MMSFAGSSGEVRLSRSAKDLSGGFEQTLADGFACTALKQHFFKEHTVDIVVRDNSAVWAVMTVISNKE